MTSPSGPSPEVYPRLPAYAETYLRPTWVEIDLTAFQHNLRAVAAALPRRVGLMPVLKADGYGHGAAALARAAVPLARTARIWGFGVSSVEEGLSLRWAGLRDPVLVLGSLYPFESLDVALDHRLTPILASRAAAQVLAGRARRRGTPAVCHVKIDTGMGRVGMTPDTAREALPGFFRNPFLRVEGVCTHFASADSAETTGRQLKVFEEVLDSLPRRPRWVHAANSAALVARPASHFNLVRPGLILYGLWPDTGGKRKIPVRPVLSWKTRVVFVKMVPRGTPLSYGGLWRARRRSRIATLPVGYADGYRRDLSNRGRVLIKGQKCPVVGRVTMDQILVDITGLPGVDVGEEAVLIGTQGKETLSAEQMAADLDTVAYEVVCGISKRVPRVYRGLT